MKYTEILEANTFDKNGLYIVQDAGGKKYKDDKATVKKVLSTPGEFLFTKYNGETITIGQDEEEAGTYFVSGRLPNSFKEFKNFNLAYSYWVKTYRKKWKDRT